MVPETMKGGTVLHGTYRIVRRIGVGGMGEVYEAAHLRLPGRYAIKLLFPEVAASPEAFTRFRREAEITSALRHPHIVQVVDFNHTPEGFPYMVMEFLEGTDLGARIKQKGAVPLERTLAIAEQVASALTAAHDRGVVHRDLKPGNVFLVRVEGSAKDFAKVFDFGISKVKTAAMLTAKSTLLGTPQYMSPEQARGRADEIDPRTDQFALAAIVHHMLSGQPPFTGGSLHAILYAVVHNEPPKLEGRGRVVGPDLDRVLGKAMAKEKEARFPTISGFGKALEIAINRTILRLTPQAHPEGDEFEESTTGAGAAAVENGDGASEPRGPEVGATTERRDFPIETTDAAIPRPVTLGYGEAFDDGKTTPDARIVPETPVPASRKR